MKFYTLQNNQGLILKFMIYCGILDDLGGKARCYKHGPSFHSIKIQLWPCNLYEQLL